MIFHPPSHAQDKGARRYDQIMKQFAGHKGHE